MVVIVGLIVNNSEVVVSSDFTVQAASNMAQCCLLANHEHKKCFWYSTIGIVQLCNSPLTYFFMKLVIKRLIFLEQFQHINLVDKIDSSLTFPS